MLVSCAIQAMSSTRNLEAFTELKVSESITVELVKANNNQVEIEVQSGNDEDLITKVSDGVLRIFWKKGMGYNRTARVKLSFKELDYISTSAGAKVISNEVLNTKELKVMATSGGAITLEVECNKVDANVSSGSKIKLEGSTKTQQVDASSGGSYKADALTCETTEAKASSGASIFVHASNSIKAEAGSGGSIKYMGDPQIKDIEASKMSGGRISGN